MNARTESMVPELLDRPGTHVLVIGVSAYRHFDGGTDPNPGGKALGMEQLTSAAKSASDFAAWMLDSHRYEQRALSSLRVLLSPSSGEQINAKIQPWIAGGKHQATIDNAKSCIRDFRSNCDLHKENIAVVYVAGHGVQLTKSGAIVLMTDCGSTDFANALEAAVDMAGVHAGFNHTETAQSQFWFVDACRQKPAVAKQFEHMAGAYQLDERVGTARANLMLLSAVTGQQAYARVNGSTLFNESLMAGLGGSIAAPPDTLSGKWHVSAYELIRRLDQLLADAAARAGVEQNLGHGGSAFDSLFHEYDKPPRVPLKVNVTPAAAAAGCLGSLRGAGGYVFKGQNKWPLESLVEAGLYELAISQANVCRHQEFMNVRPPAASRDVPLLNVPPPNAPPPAASPEVPK